jgi:hypothetical protein
MLVLLFEKKCSPAICEPRFAKFASLFFAGPSPYARLLVRGERKL